jgi:hypothetical protein
VRSDEVRATTKAVTSVRGCQETRLTELQLLLGSFELGSVAVTLAAFLAQFSLEVINAVLILE